MESSQERTHARSGEEENILERSNKKVKAGELGLEQTLTDTKMPTAEQRPASFRDKLLGRNTPHAQDEADDWISDDEEISHEEETDPDCPIVKLSKEEKARFRRPWKQTLIIKLLGRSIGYHLLLRKIQELWRPSAAVDLVALDNGLFMAKFSSMEDHDFSSSGAPWMIFDHYLIVRPSQPNFNPTQDTLQNLLV